VPTQPADEVTGGGHRRGIALLVGHPDIDGNLQARLQIDLPLPPSRLSSQISVPRAGSLIGLFPDGRFVSGGGRDRGPA